MRKAVRIIGYAIAVLGFASLIFGTFAVQLDPQAFEASPALYLASATQTILFGGFLFLGGLICIGLSRQP